MAADADSEALWRTEVLAPLRASMACMEGRLQEQEAALSQATRDGEMAAAQQRRAERLATELTERCEWLERKLEVAKRTGDSASENLERSSATARRAESELHSVRDELRVTKEQLLLVARSHRELEETVASAQEREEGLLTRLQELERGRAAAEQAVTAAVTTSPRGSHQPYSSTSESVYFQIPQAHLELAAHCSATSPSTESLSSLFKEMHS